MNSLMRWVRDAVGAADRWPLLRGRRNSSAASPPAGPAAGGMPGLEIIFDSMHEAVLITDASGRILRANPAAALLLETTPDELAGRELASLLAGEGQLPGTLLQAWIQRRELSLRTLADREVPVSCSCALLGEGQGYVITAHSIAERRLAEQRIRYLARIDPLTKVPNRMQFQHLMQRAIARARRSRQRLAMLYLDLDRFKEINDSHGHSAGDLCLETLTSRLGEQLPSSAVIGRLAGDEFGILLDNLPAGIELEEQVRTHINPALEALGEPVGFQGHLLHLAASIGIAFYPRDAGNVLDLIRNADAALYHAKRRGGGGIDYYHPAMNAAAVERLMLKSRLRQAFSRDELRVHYQPRISLTDGRLVGAEALVRWALKDRGLVLPAEFIPLAEESSLILELGEWVLDRVCADLASWPAGATLGGRISVNLSLRQLNQRDFPGRVGQILDRHGIDPGCLELEITESTMMENPERTIGILRELHEMGLTMAIDDFGTGYSSLSALQQFPISILKVDQSFVGNVTDNHDQATIVAMIIEMGHSLEMDVVAEGVETSEQLHFLRALNCDQAQGLLFGPVMSGGDFHAAIAGRIQSSWYPTSSM